MSFTYAPTIQSFQAEFTQWRSLLSREELPDAKLESFVNAIVHERGTPNEKTAVEYLRDRVNQKLAKICNQQEAVKTETRGDVSMKIEYADGRTEDFDMRNTVLRKGKEALANCLVNDVDDPFSFYVSSMIFGTNGTSGGTPKFVDEVRTGLFGSTLLTKNVISSIDDGAPTTAIFTSVIPFSEGNGNSLNEMALKLKNGDLYSMITFPDLNKTSAMQLTVNWSISFL